MKKIAFILGFVLLHAITSVAQQAQALPIDPKVRYGKLENGLTYYIRHNELPKQQADFYIAQNVGAILEEDDQQGLAHFLEHMAFNGTTHFRENTLISYLESIGVKFGVNLNASTEFDKTVYNISNVPVTREGIIDSCLLILHDWSGFVELEESEIDKERGVILEEMRMFMNANRRMLSKTISQAMPESQYAKRNVIGHEDFLKTFPPEKIRAYYEKWYRPDLQALIIVGDIDPEQIENKLKKLFADIPAPVNPAERIYYQVEDNEEPIICIISDKEATMGRFDIYFKHDPLPKEMKASINGLVFDYFNAMTSLIMDERLAELTQQANPPFMVAGVINEKFLSSITKEALIGIAIVKGNEYETGLKAISRELERLNKYGFTASEYERAKAKFLAQLENAFKEKDKTNNGKYADEYVRHFTDGGYIPGIEMEYTLFSTLSSQISVELINQYLQELIGDKNIVITLMTMEKEGETLPTKENLLTWFNEAKKEDIKQIEETVNNEPLLFELPTGGSIVTETKDDIFESTIYNLSNGVKVVVKSTNLKDDEIRMSATSPGGNSHFPDEEIANRGLYGEIISVGGLGKFSQTELTKALAGKKVSVRPTIDFLSEGFSGSSSVKDFETMLQLIYLNFTAPRIDDDAYTSLINRYKVQLENIEANPQIAFTDSINKEIYQNRIRNTRMKATDLSKANYQTIMDWQKDRYADASDFTFVFAGNIDPETAKPLLAKYLGSLPSINRKEAFVPVNQQLNAGKIKNAFTKQMENPSSYVLDVYWTTFEPTLKNRMEVDMLQQILNIALLENIREKEGGVYVIQAVSTIEDYPKGQTPFQIVFQTEPGKETYLNEAAKNEFQSIADKGPREADFNKAKEFMQKKQQEQEQENSYWVSAITGFYRTGYNSYTDYVKTLNAITPSDIQKKAQSIIHANNLIEVVMTGVDELKKVTSDE
jgi:zinc protease